MQGIGISMLMLWVIVVGAVLTGQEIYPIFTRDDLVKAMKTIDQNVKAVHRALPESAIDTAKERLSRAREQLATTITFWRHAQKDDAVRFLRSALIQMDRLDAAISAKTVDPTAVSGNVKE